MPSALAIQAERLRAMTADQKVRIANGLWTEARALAAAGVRGRHPDWDEDQVNAEVRKLMRGADA